MKEELKFYASGKNYTHKLFTFQVNNLTSCQRIIDKFKNNGNTIHAAYHNWTSSKGVLYSRPFNLYGYGFTGLLIPQLKYYK